MATSELRIVSLIPSATEIVASLGYGDALVGRSHECDFPAFVRDLPICTAPKFDPEGTSGEIHQRVSDLLLSALSVYRINAELLAELRPTHIITQAQCEVCAVSLSDVEQAVSELAGTTETPIQVVSLQPNRLADVWEDMDRVAIALSANQKIAQSAVESLKARLNEIRSAVNPVSQGLRVACIEWSDPLMCAGNWVPELVAIAGGTDCFGKTGEHSAWMDWDALIAADPEVIVVMPCGYDLAKTRQATEEMAHHPSWPKLQAVRTGQVYLTDGNQYFNRPGPRLVESAEILAEIFRQSSPSAEVSTGQPTKRAGVGWEVF
ncbi:MAG: cobalamin-binding protein [Cyanobacteria bacterium J06614_10]